MIELLVAVAIAFTGHPVTFHCPRYWPWPNYAGLATQHNDRYHIYMPLRTCRDLARPPRTREHVGTLTHEMLHVRNMDWPHGAAYEARVQRNIPLVIRLLRRYQ